jgi:putative transcriptional regulator
MSEQAQLQARLLDAYAAGSLDAGMRLLVETQAALRPVQDLHLADEIGGAALEREAPAAMTKDALARVFAQIDALPLAPPRKRAQFADEIEQMLPSALRGLALDVLATRGWNFGGPGIRILPLPIEHGGAVELIRIEPGFGVPNHTHTAGEYTLVLTGAFSDERGRYGVGDIAFADPSVTHTPRAELGEVCYNLAISEAPLVLTGLMGVIQKMLPN